MYGASAVVLRIAKGMLCWCCLISEFLQDHVGTQQRLLIKQFCSVTTKWANIFWGLNGMSEKCLGVWYEPWKAGWVKQIFWGCPLSRWRYIPHRVANIARREEKVAASSFRALSSFLSFIMVSVTMAFSFSYLLFRLVRATSAVCGWTRGTKESEQMENVGGVFPVARCLPLLIWTIWPILFCHMLKQSQVIKVAYDLFWANIVSCCLKKT